MKVYPGEHGRSRERPDRGKPEASPRPRVPPEPRTDGGTGGTNQGGVGVGAPAANMSAGDGMEGVVQFRSEEGQHGTVRAATPGGGEIEVDAVTAAIAGIGGLATAGLLLV